jgi:hypothetical protein
MKAFQDVDKSRFATAVMSRTFLVTIPVLSPSYASRRDGQPAVETGFEA